jgi:hypothetical protein
MEEQKIDEEFIRNFLKDNLSVSILAKQKVDYEGSCTTTIKVTLDLCGVEISSSEDYIY